jgi:septum formation inhibitor MinC
MSSTTLLSEASWDVPKPAAVLRGNARGLEIVVDGGAEVDAIIGAISNRLAEAPAFFRGSDVRIRVDNVPLPAPALARLEQVAHGFDLRIVEVAAATPPAVPIVTHPHPASLAGGSAPVLPPIPPVPMPPPLAVFPAEPDIDQHSAPPFGGAARSGNAGPIEIVEEAEDLPPGTRLVVGPVRSGVILEHPGHLVIFGDINPGAEVRAEGNIIVLGRLRGTAHAGIGAQAGFILALRLEPQQLRLGRVVARAADKDRAGSVPEIAHVINGTIVVERYQGKLPTHLVASI